LSFENSGTIASGIVYNPIASGALPPFSYLYPNLKSSWKSQKYPPQAGKKNIFSGGEGQVQAQPVGFSRVK
jgi:hypothetical protein